MHNALIIYLLYATFPNCINSNQPFSKEGKGGKNLNAEIGNFTPPLLHKIIHHLHL